MKITYDDKTSLATSALPRANKCTDSDLNEIKQVVNSNADELDENTTDIQDLRQDISTVNEKLNTKYILVTITTKSNIGGGYQILLDSIKDNIGGKFTLSNNRIIVGSGVSKVKVSASIFVEEPQGTGYVWGQIRKNGNTQSSSIVPYNNGGGFLSSSIPPTIFNVEQGDAITLIADSTCQGVLRNGASNTWILVEVIE